MSSRYMVSFDVEDGPIKKARCDPAEEHQILHSGHFMNSKIHEESHEDEDQAPVVASDDTYKTLKDAFSQLRKMKNSEALAVEDLQKLLQKISRAYSSWFTSPRWKNFKGLCLLWKDKIRMNNLIWRAWHLQYITGRRASFCQFTCPLDDPVHSKPQAVVLEGKYWKRKLDVVTEEYKRWRIYWKAKRPRKEMGEDQLSMEQLLDKVAFQNAFRLVHPPRSPNPAWDVTDDEDLFPIMDLNDTLFSSLMAGPFPFPVPRELGQPDNADIIQPGLMPLQPSFDDLDALDVVQELLSSCDRSHHLSHAVPVTVTASSDFEDPMDVLASVAAQQKDPNSIPVMVYAQEPPRRLIQIAPKPKNDASESFDTANSSFLASLLGQDSGSLSADQKRRVNIKTGFEALQAIVPALAANAANKTSKAAMLQRGAEFCKELRQENSQMEDERVLLRRQIDRLNQDIAAFQAQLPASGAPLQPANASVRREMFDEWIRVRSLENCKFFLFALLLAPIYDSFMAGVSASSSDELTRSILEWQKQQCSLINLRKSVLSSLTLLSKSTSILASPETLPQELRAKARSGIFLDTNFASQR